MKKLFYLGYYDLETSNEKRKIVPAATNKMTYIVSAFEANRYQVTLISAAETLDTERYGGKRVALCDNSELVLLPTYPAGNIYKHAIRLLNGKIQLTRFLLKNITKDDIVIAYHSLAYANILRIYKKIIKFKLVLEVEEVYADVTGSNREYKKEYKLFPVADAFIFPTKLLDEKINVTGKPSVLIHGTYQVEPDRKHRFDDDKIHVVYAGSFHQIKGGAMAAISAATHLPSEYHVHILGAGRGNEKKNIKETIESLEKTSNCRISYEGFLLGEDYIKFIQSCDIGLSTQNPDAAFNATSFPSKILSYMANGLRVVSVRIPAVEGSAIGDYMYYYDEQTPEQIALAIQKVDLNDSYDSRNIIKKLDKQFQQDLKELIEKL